MYAYVCVGGVNERVNLQAICYKQSAICLTAAYKWVWVCVCEREWMSVHVCVYAGKKACNLNCKAQTNRRRQRLVTCTHTYLHMHASVCVYIYKEQWHNKNQMEPRKPLNENFSLPLLASIPQVHPLPTYHLLHCTDKQRLKCSFFFYEGTSNKKTEAYEHVYWTLSRDS